MDSIRHAVTRTALSIAEYVVPVLRTSKFRETGVITPGEFIAAGDFLVHHCPTWQWAVGDKPIKTYLLPDKQFLVTRNVPCYKRVRQVDNHNEELEKIIDDEEIGGDWVDTHHYASQSGELLYFVIGFAMNHVNYISDEPLISRVFCLRIDFALRPLISSNFQLSPDHL